MEIKTRKQAMTDGENTYFTGKPCKNGHITYRYVQSGTCYDCINAGRVSINSPTAIAREARLTAVAETMKARAVVIDSLIQIKVWMDDVDVELFKATAYAYAVMRHPTLTQADVFPALAPTARASTMACRRVNCHIDDVAALREFEKGLQAARPTHFEVDRARRLQKALAEAHVEPVPAWANKP